MKFTVVYFRNTMKALAVANTMLAHVDSTHESFYSFNKNNILNASASTRPKWGDWPIMLLRPYTFRPTTGGNSKNYLAVLNINLQILKEVKKMDDDDELCAALEDCHIVADELINQIIAACKTGGDGGTWGLFREILTDQIQITQFEGKEINWATGVNVNIPVRVQR